MNFKGLDIKIRLHIAKNALLGDPVSLYLSCLAYLKSVEMALEIAKKDKNGRVRKPSKKRVSGKGK